MRRKIIDTLGETKNEMVIPTLCEVLLEDISPIVRIGAAKALGKIGAAING
jgi:HEAT repeat protein